MSVPNLPFSGTALHDWMLDVETLIAPRLGLTDNGAGGWDWTLAATTVSPLRETSTGWEWVVSPPVYHLNPNTLTWS